MEKIGKYRIVGSLGQGGIGQLYRAEDPAIPREVAIKVLQRAQDRDSQLRFQREAAALCRMQHRNVVTVYDFGVEDGSPYLVMELLEGEDLAAHIDPRLPLWQVMEVMQQVADGLESLHRAGVVHRDLSPANIRLLPNGMVKIIDFGLAGEVNPSTEGTAAERMGTALYRAPEHFGDARPDHRADIFAYGLIYYELVTGIHPFASEDANVLSYRIAVDEPRPIRELTPECPPELASVISQLLVKDRDLRYQNLEDVQVDVEPVLYHWRTVRAAELVTEANGRIADSQLSQAYQLLRDALKLDPRNEQARELRRQVQARQHDQIVEAKVQVALEHAAKQTQQHRYGEAIQQLESVLRLDPENEVVIARLAAAQSAWELRRKLLALLRSARESFHEGRVDEAWQTAQEAAAQDPADPEAAALLQTLRTEIEQRAQVRLSEKLISARLRATAHQYDQALAQLAEVAQERPEEPQVIALIQELTAQKAAYEQQQVRLQAGLDQARQILSQRAYDQAIPLLEQLSTDFPESLTVKSLLSSTRAEQELQVRARIVETTSIDVQKYAAFGEYQQALDLLETVLRFYPGEETCMRMLAAISKAREEQERFRNTQSGARGVCRECGTALFGTGKFCDRCGARSN